MNTSTANDSTVSTGQLYVPHPPSTAHQVTIIVVYAIMFSLSLSGNALTVCVILSRPYMRSVTNCLIANMAVADLLMTFSAMPYSVAYMYVENRMFDGIMGVITCKMLHFCGALSISASILTLTVIALDRFFAVAFPFKRARVIRKISATNSAIWTLSVILMSPYLYYFKAEQDPEDDNYYCNIKWEPFADTSTASRVFFSFTFISLYLVPLFFIAIFYGIVAFKLWVRRIPGNPTAANRREAELSKRRTIKMLIIVVIVFALCWLPAHVMHFFIEFYEETSFRLPNYLYLAAFGVSHANSAINPYLYIVLNRNYRRAFLKVIRGCCRPEGNLLSSQRSNTTSQTNLTLGMSLEYVAAFGRKGMYELHKTEKNKDLPCVRQISLLKVTETESKQEPAGFSK